MNKVIDATDEKELMEIKNKINAARAWARKHFNADKAKTQTVAGALFWGEPPAFFVEFPSPDTMRVTPSLFGKPASLWFEYRLCFKSDDGLEWHGTHPFYNTPLPPLIVKIEKDEHGQPTL